VSIENHEFAAFLLGDASDELAARIRAEATTDEGFAAELGAFAPLGSTIPESLTTTKAQPKRFRRLRHLGRRSSVLAAGLLLTLCGAVWGGYELLRTRPLLEDTFNTGTIEYGKWDPRLGRKGISARDGYLRLINRGSLVTRQEFDGPIEITFDWRWVDHGEWPLYAETFCVCLRTHGEHKPEHDFAITDGLVIDFNTVEHNLHIGVPGLASSRTSATPDVAPMPAESWHHIRIVDDGQTVAVFIEGPSIDPRHKREPILTATIPNTLTGQRAAFFNREYVGGTNHESHVDNVKIRAVAK
jgi:hypothetical protein